MTMHNPYQFAHIDQRYNQRKQAEALQRIEQIRLWVLAGRTDVARMAAEIGLCVPTVRNHINRIKREMAREVAA